MIGSGRYRLRRRLGAGGMASVWLADDDRLSRSVAVKLMTDRLADDAEWRERFQREARAAAAISHPNVVSVFDFGLDEGRPFLVMQFVDGVTLAEALRDGHAIDAGRLAIELLEALDQVHAAGIVHRDVKPANILLDGSGRAYLTDFGIAQSQDATALTQTGVVIGTLSYLAPEVLTGASATAASDLYAAGKVIAEAAGADQRLQRLTDELTAQRPADRPASARAALATLHDAKPSEVTDTTRRLPHGEGATTATRVLLTRGSSRVVVGGLVAALAVLIVAVLVAGRGDETPQPAEQQPSSIAIPAPEAPLQEQLDAIDAAVRRAAR